MRGAPSPINLSMSSSRKADPILLSGGWSTPFPTPSGIHLHSVCSFSLHYSFLPQSPPPQARHPAWSPFHWQTFSHLFPFLLNQSPHFPLFLWSSTLTHSQCCSSWKYNLCFHHQAQSLFRVFSCWKGRLQCVTWPWTPSFLKFSSLNFLCFLFFAN